MFAKLNECEALPNKPVVLAVREIECQDGTSSYTLALAIKSPFSTKGEYTCPYTFETYKDVNLRKRHALILRILPNSAKFPWCYLNYTNACEKING